MLTLFFSKEKLNVKPFGFFMHLFSDAKLKTAGRRYKKY